MEGLQDIEPPFVADGQAPEAREPCQGALDDPAMAAEALAALDAAPGDPRGDAPSSGGLAAAREVVALVGVELGRPPARAAGAVPDRRHRVDQRGEAPAVVLVRRAEGESERDAVRVGEDVALGAGLAAVGRVRARRLAPLLAANDALSSAARDQSTALARPSRSSRTRRSLAQIPACCQSRSRRQQVIPDPQPICRGSRSQPMPVRSTKTMPSRQARSGTRGRPPLGLGGSGGRSGAISRHRAPETRGAAMPDQPSPPCRVPVLIRALRFSVEMVSSERIACKHRAYGLPP
jgi:hypothetical protein